MFHENFDNLSTQQKKGWMNEIIYMLSTFIYDTNGGKFYLHKKVNFTFMFRYGTNNKNFHRNTT